MGFIARNGCLIYHPLSLEDLTMEDFTTSARLKR